MHGGDWLVKIRRYDGSDSVLASWPSALQASRDAEQRNADEQTSNYYIERFDPERLRRTWPDPDPRQRPIEGIQR